MKLLIANKKAKTSGFTLIELLVVIGILGILAAALLATIDPLEQFRKATDANTKSVGSSLVGSIQRYYATRQVYPWQPLAVGGDNCNGGTAPASVLASSAGFTTCITALIAAGELKTSFATSTSLASLTINLIAATNEITGCYEPLSKAESLSLLTNYTAAGASAQATCNGVTPKPLVGCYWCVR